MSIIIGDIHGNVEKVKAFLAYKPEEEHVALGDYLDSFYEPQSRQIEALQLLLDSKAVLLWGNHDLHYLKNPLFQFPGFNPDHALEFQEILEANIRRFKVAYAVDGWLCTHAGVKSQLTEQQSDVTVLAEMFNNAWDLYLKERLVDQEARYSYQSIFEFNYCMWVEGNLLPENIRQIFGHVEHNSPIVEPHFIALDATNNSNSCWIYDTSVSELVPLPMETKIGRVRFQGGGWL